MLVPQKKTHGDIPPSLALPSGSSQPRPPEPQRPRPPLLDQQLGAAKARDDGPEAGPVGPDGRRGGARLEGRPAGHEAAKEGRGEAEVRAVSPLSARLSWCSYTSKATKRLQADWSGSDKEGRTFFVRAIKCVVRSACLLCVVSPELKGDV